jgi:succinyl-CoA synthetase alpha subunit
LVVDNKLFIGKNVIIQGITGGQGSFHAKAMKQARTNVIAGTSPNKAGQTVDDIPVYSSIKDIAAEHTIDVSVIFVPAPFAKAAILEAIAADIPLIICITEGVPIHDMLQIKQRLVGERSTLIGPNCPGVLLPSVNKLGIIPSSMGLTGSVGIVSRSGTLTYEAMAGLTARGIGQKYVIGIGGDPIRGTGFIECLELFENDPEVTSIVMIGEIGGTDEITAAEYIKKHITKPVFGYIAGHHAPAGVQLGHAGAILGSENESAAAKTTQLSRAGVTMSESVVQLTNSVK